jgi:hypothetical protein
MRAKFRPLYWTQRAFSFPGNLCQRLRSDIAFADGASGNQAGKRCLAIQ